ncbi:MAG: rhodanese-like domain-containing protein [Alphaproteobacteria bacterium]|nr:rhodanese-like domain-containing protein [Alphaproteobacteria bacterium]
MLRILLKAVAILYLGTMLSGPAAAQDGVIDAPTALQLQNEGAITIVDIRRPQEWQDTGIPRGARAISMHHPDGPAGFLAAVLDSVDGDKSTPIALICASGVRSTWASTFLARSGFTSVYNIKEGMLGRGRASGWIARGNPVEPPPAQ